MLAEAFVGKNLSDAQLLELEQRLAQDKNFATEFHDAANLIRSLQNAGSQQRFSSQLNAIRQTIHAEQVVTKPAPRMVSLRTHYLRTAAVAAGVALLASVSTVWLAGRTQRHDPAQYSELRKEIRSDIEGIKQSQDQIMKDLKNKANKPAIENKYSGTGFALSNDGYLVTNYHVTEGADSLYIQTHDGSYYKAYMVSFDAQADLAILKIQQKDFKFSKATVALPYTFATAKIGLGAPVYTLGYPQDEVVYSEGYIASRNGYLGDSAQYRLELPAEPGQSGAPVMDASGNVVAIVTGKESKSAGTTFAVSSRAMLKLLHSVPEAANIHLPKAGKMNRLNRTQQIEKLQDFTCVVKVYK